MCSGDYPTETIPYDSILLPTERFGVFRRPLPKREVTLYWAYLRHVGLSDCGGSVSMVKLLLP